MASSAEIKESINKKEKEIKELKDVKKKVKKLDSELTCVQSKFAAAGALIVEAGDIGGVPFESGKTAQTANDLKKISDEVALNIEDIEKRIDVLEEEVEQLKIDYANALAAEAAAAKAASGSDSESDDDSDTDTKEEK